MIYAVRKGVFIQTLVEFKSPKEFDQVAAADPTNSLSRVSSIFAHNWVKAYRVHETGLYVDQGRVRYAHPTI